MVLVSIWNQEFMSVEHTKETSNSEVILPESDHDLLCIARVLQKDSDSPHSDYTYQSTQKMTQKRDDGNWETVRVPFHSSHIEISSGVQIADINEAFEVLRDRVTDIISNPRPVHETITYGYPTSEAQTSKLIPRIKSNFSTSPQHLHYLDIDSIIAPSKLRGRHLSELAGWLNREIFPDWLRDSTYIIQATGSHGCISKCGKQDVPRLRIILWLKERVTPEEFKVIAQAINTDMKSGGVDYIGGDPLDTTIYTRGRMLFFAPPVINSEGVPYTHDRLVLVEGDYDEVRIPEELIKRDSSNVVQLQIGGGYSASEYAGLELENLLEKLKSDGSHAPILAMMARFAEKYPNKTDRENAIIEFTPTLLQKLREISANDDEYQRRFNEEIGSNSEKLIKSAEDYFNKFCSAPVAKPEIHPVKELFELKGMRRIFPKHLHIEVRKLLAEASSRNAILEYRIPPGFGKSFAAIRALGDMELLTRHRIIYLSATYEQSEERYNEFVEYMYSNVVENPDEDLPVRLWKGRTKHCLVNDQPIGKFASRLEKVGQSPIEVCKKCSHYSDCGWISQREDKENGVIFAQHANLTTTFANAHLVKEGCPSLIILDESWLQILLNQQLDYAPLNEVRGEKLKINSQKGDEDRVKTEELYYYRNKLADALSSCEDLVSSELVKEYDDYIQFPVRHIYAAKDIESDHQACLLREISVVRTKVLEVVSKRHLDEFSRLSRTYKVSKLVSSIYRAIEASLNISDRNSVVGLRVFTKNGVKNVKCLIKSPIPKIVRTVPVIALNASANEKLTKSVLGNASDQYEFRLADIKIDCNQYHLTQVAGRPFGKSMFSGGSESKPATHTNIMKIHKAIWLQAYKWKGRRDHECNIEGKSIDLLVVCQNEVKERLSRLVLPENVDVRNFPVEGVNGYKDVPSLMIIGRRSPHPSAIEEKTEALNYDNPDFLGLESIQTYGYPKHVIQMVDGTGREITCEKHPNEFAEILRSYVVDEGVIQAIHRARLFDRTSENFCDLVIFGTTDIELPVHKLKLWKSFNISLYDLSIANGIVFSSQKAARRAYNHVFGNKNSATLSKANAETWKKAQEKIPLPIQVSNKEYILGSCIEKPIFRHAEFRLVAINHTGRKPKKQYAFVDMSRYEDAVKSIEEAVNGRRTPAEAVLKCIDFEWVDEKKPKRGKGRPKNTEML